MRASHPAAPRAPRPSRSRTVRVVLAAGMIAFSGTGATANCGNLLRVRDYLVRGPDLDLAATVLQRLPQARSSCTTCHVSPGPEVVSLPQGAAPLGDRRPRWPMNAYGFALTAMLPSYAPVYPNAMAQRDFDAMATVFARVDRLPVDPADPQGPTFGDRIGRGLPPQPLFPAGEYEAAGAAGRPPERRPAILSRDDAVQAVVAEDGDVLQLSEVAEIDAGTAVELARFRGRMLVLGLRSLPADVAGTLAASGAETVWLHSLTAVDPEAAAALARRRGQLLLTGLERLESAALAEKIASRPGPLTLPYVRFLSAEAAAALVRRAEPVCLPALDDASAEVQAELARATGPIDLPALRRLESPELARALAAAPTVHLGGLETLPGGIAAILAAPRPQRAGVVLPLAALTPEALAAFGAEGGGLVSLTAVGRGLSPDLLRAIAGLGVPASFPEVTAVPAELAATAAELIRTVPRGPPIVRFSNLWRLESAELAAALGRPYAMAIGPPQMGIDLSPVRELNAEAAKVIGEIPFGLSTLDLTSLERLPVDIARLLLETPRPNVAMPGVLEMSKETLKVVLLRAGTVAIRGNGTKLVIGIKRLPPGPFAPPEGTRKQTPQFDLILPNLSALSADDARHLVEAVGPVDRLYLPVLPELSPEAAAVLATFRGSLNIGRLRVFPPAVAEALAGRAADVRPAGPGARTGLGLGGPAIQRLPAEIQDLFGKMPSDVSLDLRTLESAALARKLVADGDPSRTWILDRIETMTTDAAEVIAGGRLELNRLERLTALESPALARKLGASNKRVELPALLALAPEAAEILAAKPADLKLGLKSLSPEIATALAAHKGRLDLPRLAELPTGIAKIVAGHSGGLLLGVRTLEIDAAEALAATRGPLSLPGLTQISPKTLSALLADNDDIEIPLIETLALTPEPDGSLTDFVVPETVLRKQERQRQQQR